MPLRILDFENVQFFHEFSRFEDNGNRPMRVRKFKIQKEKILDGCMESLLQILEVPNFRGLSEIGEFGFQFRFAALE